MGLFLICPHCQAKAPLTCGTCPGCGGSLRDLPPKARRYYIGVAAAPEAAPPASEPEPTPETYPEPVEVELVQSYPEMAMPSGPVSENKDVSLCEALDRILNKGAVLFGEVMISVADIDLVYLGLQVILASMDTARGLKPRGDGPLEENLFNPGGR